MGSSHYRLNSKFSPSRYRENLSSIRFHSSSLDAISSNRASIWSFTGWCAARVAYGGTTGSEGLTMKESLVFAALERLADKAGDKDLAEYLRHGSQHSGVFLAEIDEHHNNLKDLEAFTEKHDILTHPSGEPSRTFSQVEFDAAVAKAVKRAKGKEATS